MFIDNTDITIFGIKLLKVDGHLDLPQRKRILTEPRFTNNDIRFEELEVSFRLLCRAKTKSLAASAVGDLKTLLKSQPVHRFRDAGRDLDFMGLVKDGVQVDLHGHILIIHLKVTVTQCITGNLIT